MGTLLFGPSSEFANKNANGQLIQDVDASLYGIKLELVEVFFGHTASYRYEFIQIYEITFLASEWSASPR